MSVIVQKFGGSSVADVEKIGKVADKVVAACAEGHQLVVVVSAMGKTTDGLLALAKQVDDNPPRRELDMLLTTGERVTMALLSMAIQKRGKSAISFTGSQSGIITNDRHFDARIIEVRPHRIEDELHRGKVVIVAGYQGMSYKREITTLGRGGSDTTALALAAALGAERAEIYSDVDGVYSADPRVVPDARHLAELSYDAMQEMAEAGAKVLHAAAVEHARRAGVRIHARATFQPGRETVVSHAPRDASARAVVGSRDLVRLALPISPLTAASAARELGLDVRELEGSAEHAQLLVAAATTPDLQAGLEALRTRFGAGLRVTRGLGAVSIVGDGIGRDAASVEATAIVVKELGVDLLHLTSSPSRVTLVVSSSDVDALTRALHARLLGR